LLRADERLAEAESVYQEALSTVKDHQNLAVSRTLTQLAKVLADRGKLPEAEIAGREALNLRRELLDNEHGLVSGSFHFLANLLQRQGKFEEVETLYRERLDLMQGQLPAEEPEIIHTLVRYTEVLIAAKKFTKAEPFARESLGMREKQMPGDWRIFISRSLLGACLLGQEKYAEAEPWLISGCEGLKQCEATMPDYGKPYLKEALQRLFDLYVATDQPDQAAERRQQLEELAQPASETKPAAKTTR